MKRCTRTLLLVAALLLAPCAAFAAPESAAPANDLSAGDIDYSMLDPTPSQHLTLIERLSLQNAVCALWHNSMKQDPAPVENLDPMTLDAPDHIFTQGTYFVHDGFVFEGVVRQMTPDSTGIEVISGIQHYRVQFQRKEAGGFKIVSVFFGEMGMG